MKRQLTGEQKSKSICTTYPSDGWPEKKKWKYDDKCWEFAFTGRCWRTENGQNCGYLHEAGKCKCASASSWPHNLPSQLIDSHCHLEALDCCDALLPLNTVVDSSGCSRSSADTLRVVKHVFEKQPPELVAVISNCCDPGDLAWYQRLAAAWDFEEFRDSRIYWSVGVHPYCAEAYETRVKAGETDLKLTMRELAAHNRCVAIGECGLDYCKAYETFESQRRVFAEICHLAIEFRKPLVVHARDAARDAISILQAHVPSDWPIHLHGYTDEPENAQQLLRAFGNLYIGFNGSATIHPFWAACNGCAPLWLPECKRCGGASDRVIRDIDGLIRVVPLDRLLLETDAPFMTPVGVKGIGYTTCQPWMVVGVAAHIAQKKGVTMEDVILASNRNVKKLYKIGD